MKPPSGSGDRITVYWLTGMVAVPRRCLMRSVRLRGLLTRNIIPMLSQRMPGFKPAYAGGRVALHAKWDIPLV